MLRDVKILSFTHFLQGPSAVQTLADLGADVIKVESPRGAWERHWAGFNAFLNDVSVCFLLGNRNQRSLAIDLRTDEGIEIIKKMIKDIDVVVENFRPGVMDRLGLSYEELQKVNPRLIYCSCTGYGSDGPYKDFPGQDLLLQARSGITYMTGSKESPPTPVGPTVVDQHAAVLGSCGILAALHNREKTGVGCKVDSNLYNAAIDLQIEPFTYYLNKGPLWERSSTGLASTFHQAPYGIYQTKDNWIAISLTSVDKLIDAFHSQDLKEYTEIDQMEKREEFNEIVCNEVKKKTTEEWFTIFDPVGIWYAPVYDYEQVEKDPQVRWNNVIMEIEHPDAGKVKLLNHPIRYNGKAPDVRKYPPRIGEHSIEILKELGYSDLEIKKLESSRIISSHSDKEK